MENSPGNQPNPPAEPTSVFDGKTLPNQQTDLGFLQSAGRPDALGSLGHYEVLEVLGQGGFGIVFRAFDKVLERVVAIKVLAPEMAATSPARKRFLREARAAAQVRHENVVQIHAVEELPLPYLVMEFVPGETLQRRLDRTGPRPRAVTCWQPIPTGRSGCCAWRSWVRCFGYRKRNEKGKGVRMANRPGVTGQGVPRRRSAWASKNRCLSCLSSSIIF
jgi:hypothetical protein